MAYANPRVLTLDRAQLHRLAWQKPINQLACELGITPQRLREICAKLEVPYPNTHFWQRKRAGLKAVEFQLPKASREELDTLLVGAIDCDESEGPIDTQIPSVPEKLRNPHPIIKAWRDERERLQASWPDGQTVLAWTESQNRQHRILDTLFRAAEAQGLHARSCEGPKSFILQYRSTDVECSLRQRKKRVKVVSGVLRQMRTEMVPSPELVLTIESFISSASKVQRQWCDTPQSRLEGMIGEILTSIRQAAVDLSEHMKTRELEEQCYQQQRRKPVEAGQSQRREAMRWAALVNVANDLENMTRVKRLLEALPSTAIDPGIRLGDRTLREWYEWAQKQCREREPGQLDPATLFDTVSKAGANRDGKGN